jgi:ShK domain-like
VILLVFGLTPRITLAQECGADGVCDTHERCSVWKEEGECTRSRAYMDKHCPVSCRDAAKEEPRKTTATTKPNSANNNKSSQLEHECKDVHTRCPVWAELGECADNSDMRKYCAKSCNTCDEQAKELAPEQEDELCVDTHQECNFWASKGECTNNPAYMLENCPKSCNSCVTRRLKAKKTTPKVASVNTVTEILLKEKDILDASETFGTRQEAAGAEAQDTLVLIAESNQYMKSKKVTALPEGVRAACLNRQPLCSFWALKGT